MNTGRHLTSFGSTPITLATALLLAACGGGGGGSSATSSGGNSPQTPTYRVGGTVTGLSGSGLTLQLNAASNLAVSSVGSFVFSTPFTAGSNYSVTVLTQPTNPSQTCAVTGGSGSIGSSDVTSVAISCTTNTFAVGGAVTGLAGTALTLSLNGDSTLPVSADGPFAFPEELTSGEAYVVTVDQPPTAPAQQCIVTNGEGTIGDGDVAQVEVSCATRHSRLALVADKFANTVTSFAVDSATGRMSLRDFALTGQTPVSVAVDAAGRFVYVANQSDDEIDVFELNDRAELTRVDGEPTATGEAPEHLRLHPAGSFLLVANLLSGDISVFAIGQEGSLTPVAGSPFPVSPDARIADIEISADGRHVYAVDAAAAGVWAFTMDLTTGGLTPVPGSPFPGGGANSIDAALTYGDRFLLVANSLSDDVSVFAVDGNTGELAAVAGSPFAAGDLPVAVAPDPSGRYAYVVNATSNDLIAYAIDPETGVLEPLDNGRVGTGDEPSDVSVDPSGQWLHVTNQGDSTVSAYRVSIGGVPSLSYTSAARRGPFAIALTNDADPLDLRPSHAYVTNSGEDSVSVLAIDAATGAVAAQGDPVPAGDGPYAIALHPNGRSAYVTNLLAESIQAYVIGEDGSLTANGGVLLDVDGPTSLVVEPSGRFAYVTNINDGTITVFDIHAETATLLPRASKVIVDRHVESLVIDPAGQFLYAGSATGENLYVFRIDVAGGSLTPVGSPVPTDADNAALAIDVTGTRLYAASRQVDTITAYSIDRATGALTALGDPAPVTASPRALEARPNSADVFTTNFESDSLSRLTASGIGIQYDIDFTTPDGPVDLAIDPEGRFAWIVNLRAGTVGAYRFDGSQIEEIGFAPTGVEPLAIAVREDF